MDRRLFDAARTRNIDSLHQLLRENALLLDQIALFSSEIPLHITYTAGKFDFVKEIINLKPDLAKEVNQNGSSFMHMAVVSGHLEIVSELMKVDPSLCRFQQGTHDMKTPFQFASIKGRANEINEMLSGCAECIEDVTLQKETALQLAVKCCQFEAVSVLVHWIGFSTSLYMIKILTSKFPLEFELGMCILAMFFLVQHCINIHFCRRCDGGGHYYHCNLIFNYATFEQVDTKIDRVDYKVYGGKYP